MPIYEYRCGDCATEYEFFHRSAGATEPARCPACGSERAERKVSAFSAHAASSDHSCPLPSGMSCGRCCDPSGSCPL